MSSSYIVEPQEGASKKDDTLILMVNDNGVISVDQDTLQNLILNQSNASVSVVRLGQTENDAVEGNLTLTVDPPPFIPSETNVTKTASDSSGLLDPFMEMDQEQLERLETALQSEAAKQILGENVTAMLDMLTVEERQNSIRYSIELDHCYTSRFSPSQPKPVDPLPDISISDMDESVCIDLNKSLTQTPILLPVSSANVNNSSITPIKQKVTPTPPKIVKQPVSVGSRPRRASAAMQPITTTPKSTVNSNNSRSMTNSLQQENLVKNEREVEENELFSSSESSESEESDSDSDYGTRNSRRGVRARGGRRGLTTRGGSMTAARRRAPNKQMDSEQVRRLDMEMAAAVNAMKSPEKEEKSDKISPIKPKKPLKTLGGKKKDDVLTPSIPVSEPPPIETNVLQTTNQVKANLISANMFKGDMILTKPGQDRNNQKVVFVQKQVLMNPNEIKTYGIKKQVMIPKSKLITNQGSKIITTKESKVSPTIIMKGTVPTVQQPIIIRQNVMPMETPTESNSNQIQLQKQVTPPAIKTKPVEVKKEKKKVDVNPNTPVKTIIDPPKVVETKTPVAPKKIVKKEHRKSETLVVEALGPALFSTPDIIRRVGSTSESKIIESPVVTTTCTTPVTVVSSTNTPTVSAVVTASTISTSIPSTPSIPSISSISTPVSSMNLANLLDEPMETNESINDSVNDSLTSKLDADASMLTDTLEDVKMDSKTAIADLLQPTLDSTTNTTPSKEMPPAMEHSNSSKHVSESGIEGDEHLLATLGMEAAKQLPNDEELLAEALLLQETLGVDLDNSGLVDPTNPEMPESILSSPIIEPPPPPPPITAPPIKTESTPVETPPAHIMPEVKTEPILKKDVKEPIQYVRGGRVITLPPIEAPATRSKRLQAKAEIQQAKVEKKPQIQEPPPQPKVEPIIIKTERSTRTPTHVSLKKQDMIYDMDDDDEEEEEANSDSEDDPNRLWCICRQPHNNRFMICCDMCQDWFHGKCVHVTKAMVLSLLSTGEQMENQGIEWVCPNCSKKKNEENKAKAISKRQRNSVDTAQSEKNRTPSVSNAATPNNTKAATNSGRSASTSSGVTYCVVCKKEARKASIYCSDACIWAHAEVTSTKDKPSPAASTKPAKTEVPKLKPDTRIIVYDKKSGKVLTGADAPTPLNLKAWLKEHPTYEVVKSNNFNTIQMGGKTVTAIQTQGIKTNKQLQGKSPGQAKMIYTKVPASKQTILTSSAKKTIQLSETPSTSSPQHRPRQAGNPNKTPIAHLKQTSIKTALQQQQLQHQQQQHQQQQQHHYQQQQQQQHFQISQKPIATSTPKASFSKKQEARASTSQQKQPLQKSLQQQPKQSPQQPKQQQLQPKQQQQQQSKQQQQQQPKQQQQQQLKQQQQQQPKQQQQQQPKQQQQQQQTVTKTPPPKKPDTEPIRLTVRKTLAEHLTTRIKETKDLSLTEEEILEIALQIELEMFKFFKDAGTKYRAKYRSLLFNIKDPKNLTLFRKIVDRSLTPEALVKLSPEEMASQELAEWRKKENKHQLEMIKKNELDLMSQAKSIVVKTHKGEQIIENDGAIDQVDPATPVQDIVTALNSGDAISSTVEDSKQEEEDKKFKLLEEEKKKKEKDRDREKRRGRSRDRSSKDSKRDRSSSKSKHRHKDRDRSRDKKSKKESKHKDRDRTKDKEGHKEHKSRDRDKKKDKEKKHKRSRSSSRSHSKNRHKDHKEKHKKEEDKKKEIIKTDTPVATPDKTIEDRLWRHIEDETTTNTFDGNDSDISDREPSSTVTIKTPDFNDELEKEIFETKIDETPKGTSTVWRGFVFMADVAKFFVTAQNVSGNSKEIMDKLPDHLDVVGRISPVTVWDYISKMKKNATKEIIIIRLTAVNDEEKIPYITLYSYLNSRNRFGVLGNISPIIKDFYIMPFPIGSKLPSVLLPLDGPGFEENRQHLLLGILVVHSRKKRTANVLPAITPVPAKIAKKEQQTSDRSYTPPPMNAITKDESMTPPSSPKPAVAHIKIVTQEVKETYSVISKIVPELSSKITLESSSSSDKMQLDDDDEPYSPGEPVDVALDEDEDALSTSSSLKLSQSVADTTAALTAKSSTTELQRQMEKISRQIEEERQQILTITSSYTSANDASSILPGLGLDPPDSGDTVEAYSPSDARSFTPPPQGISKLTQPILEKVSNITIPANLHEILANVKRQESTTVDPYLPSKPSATFLTTVNSAMYQNQESYSPTYNKTSSRLSSEVQSSPRKETKSTLSSLSDYDLMKKAEEELAALEAAEAATSISGPAIDTSVPPPIDTSIPPPIDTSVPPPSDTTISLPIDTSIPPPTMSVPPPLMSVPPPTMSVPPPTILVPPPTISPACNEPPPPGASFDTPHR